MNQPNPLEKVIETKVCDYAKSLGCYVRKFTSPSQRHVPDRIMLYRGRVWFIEFKRLGEKATAAQAVEHEKMRACGAIVYVVDSVEGGKQIVNFEAAKADHASRIQTRFFQ